jgi:hypothetical protein
MICLDLDPDSESVDPTDSGLETLVFIHNKKFSFCFSGFNVFAAYIPICVFSNFRSCIAAWGNEKQYVFFNQESARV